MKKRSAIIAASLAVSLLCGCASVNVNIKTAGDETGDAAPDVVSSAPQLDSADFDYTKKDDKGNIYFESHGNTWSLDDASADRYPKLSKTLSEIEDYVRKDIEDCIAENENDAKQFAADNADDSKEIDVTAKLVEFDQRISRLEAAGVVVWTSGHITAKGETVLYDILKEGQLRYLRYDGGRASTSLSPGKINGWVVLASAGGAVTHRVEHDAEGNIILVPVDTE